MNNAICTNKFFTSIILKRKRKLPNCFISCIDVSALYLWLKVFSNFLSQDSTSHHVPWNTEWVGQFKLQAASWLTFASYPVFSLITLLQDNNIFDLFICKMFKTWLVGVIIYSLSSLTAVDFHLITKFILTKRKEKMQRKSRNIRKMDNAMPIIESL